MKLKVILGVFITLVVGGAFYLILAGGDGVSRSIGNSEAVEIKCEDLHEMYLETGEVPEKLRKLNGKRVKIAGFVVPLSDNYTFLDEFLIVPDAQSCVHVPPPPANLIIQSKLKKPLPIEEAYSPAWLTGIFKIERTESQYGAAGYQMTVESLVKYEY